MRQVGPSERGRAVLTAVEPLIEALADHDARIVGAWPLGLERDGSDVDVLCHVPDPAGFDALVRDRCAGPATVTHRRPADDRQPAATVVRFDLDGVPVEVFGQAVPVERQRGYRHLLVERRLLKLGGEALADRVRAHRTQHGGSLEPAFAATLGLDGDPYEAVLALEVDDDAQLRRLVSTAVGR